MTARPSRARIPLHLWMPVAVAVVVRIAFLEASWDSPLLRVPIVDAKDFHDKAVLLATEQGLPARPYDRPPLFTYATAVVYAVAGVDMRHMLAVNAALGVVTVGLSAWIAARLFDPRVALVGGLLTALGRMPIVMEAQLLNETLETALLIGTLACLVVAISRRRARPDEGRRSPRPDADVSSGRRVALAILAAAALGALAILTRPTAALFVLPALGFATARVRRSLDPVPIAAAWLVLFAIVGTVTVRNRIVGGEWVAVSYNGGINFFIGNAARTSELQDIRPGLGWDRLVQTPRALDRSGVFDADPWAEGVRAWDRRYYRAAFEDIAADPIGWLSCLGRKALQFWSGHPIHRNLPPELFVSSSSALGLVTIPHALLAPFAFAGTCLLLFGRRAGGRLVALGAVSVWLACVLFFVTARYRVPAHPAMAIAAAFALFSIVRAFRRGGLRARGGWIALGLVALGVYLSAGDPGGARGIAPARADHLLAGVLAGAGDRPGALAARDRAIGRHPDDADVLFAPTAELLRAGRYDDAARLSDRAHRMVPDHPAPLMNLGLSYTALGRYEEAAAAFAEMADVAPRDARAPFHLGRALTMAGRPDAALAPLERAIALAPGVAISYVEKARALGRMDRHGEAITALRRALAVDPGIGSLLTNDPEIRSLLQPG